MQTILEIPDTFVAIKGKAYFPTNYRVVFTKNFIYLINKGGSGMGDFIGMQFGLLGMLISHLVKKGTIRQKESQMQAVGQDLDQLVHQDRLSLRLDYGEIRKHHLKG